MVDRYLPALADFALDEEEDNAVEQALKTEKPWDWVPEDAGERLALRAAKDRILAYHLQRHGGNCCYCRTNLNGAGPYMTDREHVLPKGKPVYRQFSYAMWNLAAACKRCNMQFKRKGDAFVFDTDDLAKFQDSENYRFIHPNFDAYDEHLKRMAVQVDTKNIVIFSSVEGSEKAVYTRDFFGLNELQVDSFDQAQGVVVENAETDIAAQVRALAKQFGQ